MSHVSTCKLEPPMKRHEYVFHCILIFSYRLQLLHWKVPNNNEWQFFWWIIAHNMIVQLYPQYTTQSFFNTLVNNLATWNWCITGVATCNKSHTTKAASSSIQYTKCLFFTWAHAPQNVWHVWSLGCVHCFLPNLSPKKELFKVYSNSPIKSWNKNHLDRKRQVQKIWIKVLTIVRKLLLQQCLLKPVSHGVSTIWD